MSIGAWMLARVFVTFVTGFVVDLEILPADPQESTPVLVRASEVYSDACYEQCNLSGNWVSARHFHIERSVVRHIGQSCPQVLTTIESEVPLGLLAPGGYTVSLREYQGELFGPGCPLGVPNAIVEVFFCVGSPCAAACDDGDDCTIEGCGSGGSECTHMRQFYGYGDIDRNGQLDVDDLFCMLSGFRGEAGCACSDSAVDLNPCGGNGIIDVDDILSFLEAFRGNPYCPAPCP